jgi:hypothetical protein
MALRTVARLFRYHSHRVRFDHAQPGIDVNRKKGKTLAEAGSVNRPPASADNNSPE